MELAEGSAYQLPLAAARSSHCIYSRTYPHLKF